MLILAELADNARASVDCLLADMAADSERRRDWWKQPVEGWDEGRIEISSVPTGERTVIQLRKDYP